MRALAPPAPRCTLCQRVRRLAPAAASKAQAPPVNAWNEEAFLDELASTTPTDAEAEACVASSLEAVEWRQLLQQVGRFASTAVGRQRVLEGRLGATRTESEALLEETAAAGAAESQYAVQLTWGGVDSTAASTAASKLSLAGVALLGLELLALATLQSALGEVQRGLAQAGVPPDQSGVFAPNAAPELEPLLRLALDVPLHPDAARMVRDAVEDGGRLKDSASPELARARGKRAEAESRARKALAAAAPSGAEVVPYEGRLCLRLAPGEPLPEGWLLVASSAGRLPGDLEEPDERPSLLAEPMGCVGSSSAAAAAVEAEAEAEQVARRALSARLAPLASDFTAQLAAVATLDAAAARARHAAALRGCRPQLLSLNSPKPLRVLGLRHPLLVETLEGPPWEPRRGAAPPPVVVPVDFSPPAGARVLLVSGSNAGGKTAACKAFALAALGARAGIFPAASAAALPWFDRVLTDVGEPQSLQAGLSTFSGRMRRLATLLRAATPRSLLLIDEVGSGTGAAEGGALGAALLEDCARGGVQLTLATSHSGALKALKHTAAAAAEEAGAEVGVSPFENAAAEFDAQRMAPTHRLLWGLPGRSRALDIALRLGMRAEVVAAARARLGERAAALEELLGGVEAARGTRRADEEAAREAREAAERDGRAVKGTLGRLDKAREALRKSTAREVAKIAEKAAQEIAARKRAEAGAEAARLKAAAAAEAAAAVKVQEQAVKAAEAVIAAQRPAAPPAAWAVGQRVRVRLTPASLPLDGIVAAVQGATLAVLVGSMQMRAPVACCELLPPAPPKAVPRSRRK